MTDHSYSSTSVLCHFSSASAEASGSVCDVVDAEDNVIGRPKRGRKRKHGMTDEEKKRRKNSNEDYVQRDGQIVVGSHSDQSTTVDAG